MKRVKGYLILALAIVSAQPAHADFWTHVGDIASFCAQCRARDRANAARDEAVANERRVAAEAAHSALVANLTKQIDDKTVELNAWTDLNVKSPEVQSSLDAMLDTAAIVKSERLKNAYYLETIKNLFRGSGKDLQMISGMFQMVLDKSTKTATETNPGSAGELESEWNDTMSSLNKLAQQRNETLSAYIVEAVKNSDGEALEMFIYQATVLRAYIVEMTEKIDQQIKIHTAELQTLNKQLNAANGKK